MPAVTSDDGTSIAYDAWGRGTGTPVLLVQGLGVDGRGWLLQRAALGRRYRCVAPDNRGTGRSDKPSGPYDLYEMAVDAIAVLDAEGIEEAHVVGASMGGVIAQIIGVLHPQRVRSLTLSCTACRHHDWRRELLAEWAEMVSDRGMSALTAEQLQWLIGPRLQKRFGMWINLLARLVLQTPPEAFVSQVEAILGASDELRTELPAVRAPTLVITGTQDSLTPVGDAEELAELIPGSRLTLLSGAAHGLMAEAPNAFNEAILSFLGEVEAQSAPTTVVDLRLPAEPAVLETA